MIFKSQKDKLMSLFERMDKYRKYQYEQCNDTNEESLTTRLLTDCDIDKERLMHIQTLEEIADLREQFHIYYNEDLPNMRLREKVLEYRDERERNRKSLLDKEKNVLEHRFGLNSEKVMNIQDVSKILGIGVQTVRKLEKQAITKIKLWFSDLKEYMVY